MHFGIPTFWDPPEDFLYTGNPTYHDCTTTSIDTSNQTAKYYPCLNPDVFNPTDLDVDDWMAMCCVDSNVSTPATAASAALGAKEVCLTAHHEGGFALWPSNYTNYSVAASKWRKGKGDVLREFADAANRWNVKICYYLNVQDDGYMVRVANVSNTTFINRQLGMLREVMASYGPVHRFWFDGTHSAPPGTDLDQLWDQVYETIRSESPATLISPYRGDVCSAVDGQTLYTSDGPAPNATDPATCSTPSTNGSYFHPSEMHGVTIQEGKDGNSPEQPTYWFWHPWACAGNVSGCPWVGHSNASRLFDAYLYTVGRGAIGLFNIPPERTGKMNQSVARVMRDVGTAINATFGTASASVADVVSNCSEPIILDVSTDEPVNYVTTMEDLRYGQRVANYSLDYLDGAGEWKVLVPVVPANDTLRDRPDGSDPRDSRVGHKRIDAASPPAGDVAKVRFNCHAALEEPIYLRSLSLHRRRVPWEE